MSYLRDPDRRIRGVGAIASVDAVRGRSRIRVALGADARTGVVTRTKVTPRAGAVVTVTPPTATRTPASKCITRDGGRFIWRVGADGSGFWERATAGTTCGTEYTGPTPVTRTGGGGGVIVEGGGKVVAPVSTLQPKPTKRKPSLDMRQPVRPKPPAPPAEPPPPPSPPSPPPPQKVTTVVAGGGGGAGAKPAPLAPSTGWITSTTDEAPPDDLPAESAAAPKKTGLVVLGIGIGILYLLTRD